MPDPDSDISSASADFRREADAPAGEDIEKSFNPDPLEATRAREQGLGVGARELNLQRDVEGSGAPTLDGGAERMTPEDIADADGVDNDN